MTQIFLTNFWIVIDLFKFNGIGCRISLYNEYQSRRVFGKLSTLFFIAIFGGLELEIWPDQCDCSCGLADLVRYVHW